MLLTITSLIFLKKKNWVDKSDLCLFIICICICILKRWLTPLFCPLQQQHPPRFQWKVNAWDRCILRYHHLNEHFDGGSSLRSCPLPIIPLSLSRAKETKKQKKKKRLISGSGGSGWGILVAKQLEPCTCNPDLRLGARFQVPSWLLAGVVLGSPQLKSLATLVNSQLGPIVSYHGTLNLVIFHLNLSVSLSLKSLIGQGEDN